MRIAIIKNGRVENVCEADEAWRPLDGSTVVPSDRAGPGWNYVAGVFSPPPVTSPPVLTESEKIDTAITASKPLLGLIRLLAKRFNLSEEQVRIAIKTELGF